jgi:hypothetical protein
LAEAVVRQAVVFLKAEAARLPEVRQEVAA